MKLKINGKDAIVSGKKSIAELVSDKKLVPEHIVVEHNMRIVSKEEWGEATLNENDSVEIVSFVGGG